MLVFTLRRLGQSVLVVAVMATLVFLGVYLLGNPIGHKPTLAQVGYLPENHRFPRYLTGRQTLDFFGALSKAPGRVRKKRTEELLDLETRAEAEELPACLIEDAGRTVVPEGTITCLGLGPAEDYVLDAMTGDLKLL